MGTYQKVLLAVDFHPDNEQIIAKAEEMIGLYDASLHVIHVVEPIAYAYTDGLTTWGGEIVSLESAVQESGRKKMTELCRRLKVAPKQSHFRIGRPSEEIHAVAKEEGIDLIVMGTHGQYGLKLLLGSTANSVLHGSTCDVLAVRVKERK